MQHKANGRQSVRAPVRTHSHGTKKLGVWSLSVFRRTDDRMRVNDAHSDVSNAVQNDFSLSHDEGRRTGVAKECAADKKVTQSRSVLISHRLQQNYSVVIPFVIQLSVQHYFCSDFIVVDDYAIGLSPCRAIEARPLEPLQIGLVT